VKGTDEMTHRQWIYQSINKCSCPWTTFETIISWFGLEILLPKDNEEEEGFKNVFYFCGWLLLLQQLNNDENKRKFVNRILTHCISIKWNILQSRSTVMLCNTLKESWYRERIPEKSMRARITWDDVIVRCVIARVIMISTRVVAYR
jgi:hypothetical protein